MTGIDPQLIQQAAALVEAIGGQAAREKATFAAGFRIGYGHGYAIGHAHGYDHAEDQAADEWARTAAHMRRLREAEQRDPRAAERRVDAAVAATERLVRAMAWRHWDAFMRRWPA